MPPPSRKIRVLVAKPGLDGHDRGAKVIAATLRDRGMEVIYTGLHQTPEMIVEAAVQEDVDVVGLSILSGAHMTLFPRVKALLDERGMGHVVLTGGGILPKEDVEALEKSGFAKLFGPGTPTGVIGEYIEAEVARRWASGVGRGAPPSAGADSAPRAGRRAKKKPARAKTARTRR